MLVIRCGDTGKTRRKVWIPEPNAVPIEEPMIDPATAPEVVPEAVPV